MPKEAENSGRTSDCDHSQTSETIPDIAELSQYLCPYDSKLLDRLRDHLLNLNEYESEFRRLQSGIDELRVDQNEHVQLGFVIREKARQLEYIVESLDSAMNANFRIVSAHYIHSRRAYEFTDVSPFAVHDLVYKAKGLCEHLDAFFTFAARQRGIIEAGASMTDRDWRELWIATLPPTSQTMSEQSTISPKEGPPTTDRFADVREFARCELKGKQRAVIDYLCKAGGEMPIADLAIQDDISWDDAKKGFENAQGELNKKLKKLKWRVESRDNNACLISRPQQP